VAVSLPSSPAFGSIATCARPVAADVPTALAVGEAGVTRGACTRCGDRQLAITTAHAVHTHTEERSQFARMGRLLTPSPRERFRSRIIRACFVYLSWSW
jgi:hypothetical protein